MLTTKAWVLPVLLGLYAIPLHALPLSGGDGKLDPSSNSANSPSEVCLYEGVVYAKGEKTAKPGPCEECVCQPPSVVCSMIKCPVQSGCRIIQRVNQCCPDYKCECEYNGQTYNNGERLDTRDEPCKVCYCKGGEVMCTSISCYHRDDCEPRFVAGQCCPKYDHCPLKDINPLDEKDDTSSANNRSYMYSPKREMQPWLLTKSVEVKVVPTVPTQVAPKSTENIASSSSEMTTRSNDEQQQTWNNVIISDWLTERRTTTEEDGSARITAYGNKENDLNFKYSPTTENSFSTDLNTNPFVIIQENRTKTEDTTSGTTNSESVTEIVNEYQAVTETGTELNTVITETPYMEKLVTIVFKETSANQFTTGSDVLYNDKSNTEMPLHFATESAGNMNIPLQETENFINIETTTNVNEKVQSINELASEVNKNFASTSSPSYVETSSTFPEETNTLLFTENNTGITQTDYDTTTDVDAMLTERAEMKTTELEEKSVDSTENGTPTSSDETILTTADTTVSGNSDLVTQSTLSAENENKEIHENLMLKDTSLLNVGSKREAYSNNERNSATDNNDQQQLLQETETTPTEMATVGEHSPDTDKSQSESDSETSISTVSNEGGTDLVDDPEKLNQSKTVESVSNTDILQQGSNNVPDEPHDIVGITEETIRQSDDNRVINTPSENSEVNSGNAEEIGTEVNGFNSEDGNKNTDDYSYEPPVLELNSQLPFLQIGGHGSMEILSTDGSEEDGTPESENVQPFTKEHVNNFTETSNEEPTSSSTHIPLTPGDLKILAEYLIKEKIKPTINESSTYMPTEWLKANLTSNTTKIATILSAANISIGIINRNKSDSIVKLTEGNLENNTLLQESTTTQTLDNLLNIKEPITESVDLVKNGQNSIGESDNTVVTLPSSLEVTNSDINETEGIVLTELLSTTSDYSLNKDNVFVENMKESSQLQETLNKSSEEEDSKETSEADSVENKNENNRSFNSINADTSKKNVSLPIHTNINIEKVLPTGENSLTKNNEVESSSGNVKLENKEVYENVFYPEDNSNNTNNLKNLSNHKKRINPGESDEYTSRKVRIPEMESIVKEPFSASLDDNDLTILKEFLKKHMVVP